MDINIVPVIINSNLTLSFSVKQLIIDETILGNTVLECC